METRTESTPEAMALHKRVVAALRWAGAVGPDPEEVAQYLAQSENRCWTPIQAGGKPASQMIVEERDSRPWVSW